MAEKNSKPNPVAHEGDRRARRASSDDRVETVRKLLKLFRVERVIHLSIALVSVLMLLTCAGMLLFKHQPGSNLAEVIGLFGSSGAITYSAGRLLKMWDDAIRLITPQSDTDE